MESAESLFSLLIEGRIPLFDSIVKEGWAETLSLDFKTAGDDKGAMTKDDRKNLAEALSGFANSEGGIIVWGIDCRKDEDGVDVASELKPINGIKRFLSDLESNTPQVVSPGVIGARHDLVPTVDDSDTGYAVTYVPKGQGLPHMAIARDQHRYYYRSGGSFLKMEAFMVADRYSRRPQPDLQLSVRLTINQDQNTPDGTLRQYEMVVGIKNEGLGIALYPALRLIAPSMFGFKKYGLDGNGNDGLSRPVQSFDLATTNQRFYSGRSDDAIHPGIIKEVTKLECDVNIDLARHHQIEFFVDYEIYCDGFSTKDRKVLPLGERFLTGTIYV